MPTPLLRLLLIPAALLAASAAQAGTLAAQGSFSDDDQVFVLPFTLPGEDTVTATSLGFAGGTRSNGAGVGGGGFATVLSLFDGGGWLLQSAVGSSNGCAGANVDAATGFAWDACFSVTLPAGSYLLTLSQDGNTALGPNWSDGFLMTGQPDYTGLSYLGVPARFVNVDGSQRTGDWALDVTAAAIPEPGAALLWLAGLGTLAALGRARRQPGAGWRRIQAAT